MAPWYKTLGGSMWWNHEQKGMEETTPPAEAQEGKAKAEPTPKRRATDQPAEGQEG